MKEWVRSPLLIVVGLLAHASAVHGSILVRGTVTPLGGSFLYVFEVENTGPDDYVIVSLDAPVADPLIGPTLTAPAGFVASYDSGLGIVDFLEGADLFAAGTIHGGFSFESLAGPGAEFGTFEALTASGASASGDVELTVLAGPATPMITIGGTAGSTTVGGTSTPCQPLEDDQVVVYDCGTDPADCAGCAPGFPPMPCPNPAIGMGTKDSNGNFQISVSPLLAGHYIYVSDACSAPPLNVGLPFRVLLVAAAAPLLSVRLLALLIAVLGLVGLFGFIRRDTVR
jgi:hypothetical protein